jgi:hypothetical protein
MQSQAKAKQQRMNSITRQTPVSEAMVQSPPFLHPVLPNNTASDGHSIQDLYTSARTARNLDTAFCQCLYVEAGSAFPQVNCTATHARTDEQARQKAARAPERAKLLKIVKPDVAPVWRDSYFQSYFYWIGQPI